MKETPIDLFENDYSNNKLKRLSNYWYCSKMFISNNNDVCKNYNIENNIYNDNHLENLYSINDFYYFIIVHIDCIIKNFNILNFIALNIHQNI